MMKLKSTAAAALVLLSSLAAQAQADRKVYIVQLKEEPAASYQGTTAGYAATQAAAGTPFQSRTPAALAYSGYLRGKQLQVLAAVSSDAPISQFDTVVNGFTALLTPAQATQLSLNSNVAVVAEDQLVNPATISTPVFLGLTAPGGVWSQTDANGLALKGEGMVHGNLDLGIWPENPAYADHVDANGVPTFTGGTQVYGPPPATFKGGCVAADAFVPATACNNKLIGAKYYSANLLATKTLHWTAFNSPRDDLSPHGGHGDHTAATVAGNSLVPAVVNGITMGGATGMAPRARIASYKVCFTFVNAAAQDGTGSQNSCSQADSMAAIDEAVKDGVNSINFSISGATGSTNDIVEQAFYRAALAGVFVAAAAGNDGPTNTVNHPSPWLATVAAATHDRLLSGDVTLGNAAKYTGASLNANALGSAPLIRAEDAGIAGASANLNLCFSNPLELDPAKVAGKIVVCTRGTNARVDKSLAVLNAGGVGMVLVDNGAGLVSETHSVPTVHVTPADGAAIKTYAAAGGSPTASETAFYFGHQPAPVIANFSGRGPNMADSNVLKPDLAAPGVDVIAAVTPTLTQAERNQLSAGTLANVPNAWESYNGTSMATPHVTGVALLIKQAHPSWSPAAIKSAMMTTAMDTLDDGLTGMQNGKLPWSQGAGFIVPNKAIDPGLVYDMGKADFVKYQCLTQKSLVSAADCSTYGALDQTYNLNLPSITLGTLTGPATVTRSVTNVGTTTATYTASATLPGMGTVAVNPTSLTLAPGQTKSFTVALTPSAATPKFTWMYGSLSWTDGMHVVRSPMQAFLGASITAPAVQPATTTSGARTFTIRTAFAGKATARKGIQDVTVGPVTSLTANANIDIGAACQAGTALPSVAVYSFSIPANTIVARFALRQVDVSGSADDNDLAIVAPDGTTQISGSGSSREMVQVLNPVAGTYKVCVQAYAGTAPMTHKLSSWIVKTGDTVSGSAFNVLMPATVYAGGSATAGISWSGLQSGHRYLGGAQFLDSASVVSAASALSIDTTPGAPTAIETPAADSKKGTGF